MLIGRAIRKNQIAGDDRRSAARRLSGEEQVVAKPRYRLEFLQLVVPDRGLDARGRAASSLDRQLDLDRHGVSANAAPKLLVDVRHPFVNGGPGKSIGTEALHRHPALGAGVSHRLRPRRDGLLDEGPLGGARRGGTPTETKSGNCECTCKDAHWVLDNRLEARFPEIRSAQKSMGLLWEIAGAN